MDAAGRERTPARFEAVIFDVGGVLTTPPRIGISAYAERNGIELRSMRDLFAVEHGAWQRFERGLCTWEEFEAAFSADATALGMTVVATEFMTDFYVSLAVREDMLTVVKALRPHLKLGCITNNFPAVAHLPPMPFEYHGLFDVVVESAVEGVRKPDPEIFNRCLARLGVEASKGVFLDDLQMNLDAARHVGLHAIKVDETDAAIAELEDLLGLSLR